MTAILNLIFRRGRVTKILNFALKIKGLLGRVAHAKSSDPAIPSKFETCTFIQAFTGEMADIVTNLTL